MLIAVLALALSQAAPASPATPAQPMDHAMHEGMDHSAMKHDGGCCEEKAGQDCCKGKEPMDCCAKMKAEKQADASAGTPQHAH